MWRRLSLLLSCRRVTTSGGHHFIFLPCTYTGLKCPWCRYCGPKVFTVKPSELVREHLNCPVTAKVLLSLQSRQSSHHVSFTKHFNRRHQQILSLDFAIFSPRHIFFLFLLPLPLLFPTLSCEAASFVASGRVGGCFHRVTQESLTVISHHPSPAPDGPSVLVLGVLGGGAGTSIGRLSICVPP